MIDRVVLYIEMLQTELRAEPMAMQQRREAGVRPDIRFAGKIDRQKLAIQPQIVRALLDHAACKDRANLCVVLGDLERPETGLADMQRAYRILLPALATFQ